MRRHNEETPHLPRRVQRRTFAERKATTKLDTEFEILGLKSPSEAPPLTAEMYDGLPLAFVEHAINRSRMSSE